MKRSSQFLAIALITMATPGSVSAAVIAKTSFENEATGGQYNDTGDAAVDHALVNNPGEAPVNSTATSATAGDLGFSASYISNGGVGLTDGDFFGVTSFTGTVGAFVDGLQGYQMSDVDGIVRLTFDTVSISGMGPVEASLNYFVAATGWETTNPVDYIRIFATVDGVETALLDTTGSDINDLAIEGVWQTSGGTFSGNDLSLTVEFASNAASEALFIDNVKIASSVPEPSALTLLGISGLVAAGRRRRRA